MEFSEEIIERYLREQVASLRSRFEGSETVRASSPLPPEVFADVIAKGAIFSIMNRRLFHRFLDLVNVRLREECETKLSDQAIVIAMRNMNLAIPAPDRSSLEVRLRALLLLLLYCATFSYGPSQPRSVASADRRLPRDLTALKRLRASVAGLKSNLASLEASEERYRTLLSELQSINTQEMDRLVAEAPRRLDSIKGTRARLFLRLESSPHFSSLSVVSIRDLLTERPSLISLLRRRHYEKELELSAYDEAQSPAWRALRSLVLGAKHARATAASTPASVAQDPREEEEKEQRKALRDKKKKEKSGAGRKRASADEEKSDAERRKKRRRLSGGDFVSDEASSSHGDDEDDEFRASGAAPVRRLSAAGRARSAFDVGRPEIEVADGRDEVESEEEASVEVQPRPMQRERSVPIVEDEAEVVLQPLSARRRQPRKWTD